MNRREFVRLMGWGLAAGWAGSRLAWPLTALAGTDRGVRLALLADAHLIDGDDRRPEALRLARAVAEIRGLSPAPDLVLFAGDLADRANPRALALGREILSDLKSPLFLVMGEGDGLPDESGPWRRLFGEPRFSHSFPVNTHREGSGEPTRGAVLHEPFGSGASREKFPPAPQPSPPWGEREKLWRFSGQNPSILSPKTENRKQKTVIQVLGLHTSWCPGPAGPGFYVGESGRRWLARELTRLDPDAPLVVLSHAPLARVFRPWQQWTGDAPQVAQLLAPFRQVLCFHGHVHRHAGFPEKFDQPPKETPPPLVGGSWGEGDFFTPTLTLPPQGGGHKRETVGPGVRGQASGTSGQGSGASSNSKWHCDLSTGNRQPEPENHLLHQGLPATAWPRPLAPMGTPAALRPGLGPRGCGWAQLSLSPASRQFQPRLWQA
ncbi:MAG: metallophosphoesterase [Pseudomonadota bacterium]